MMIYSSTKPFDRCSSFEDNKGFHLFSFATVVSVRKLVIYQNPQRLSYNIAHPVTPRRKPPFSSPTNPHPPSPNHFPHPTPTHIYSLAGNTDLEAGLAYQLLQYVFLSTVQYIPY